MKPSISDIWVDGHIERTRDIPCDCKTSEKSKHAPWCKVHQWTMGTMFTDGTIKNIPCNCQRLNPPVQRHYDSYELYGNFIEVFTINSLVSEIRVNGNQWISENETTPG